MTYNEFKKLAAQKPGASPKASLPKDDLAAGKFDTPGDTPIQEPAQQPEQKPVAQPKQQPAQPQTVVTEKTTDPNGNTTTTTTKTTGPQAQGRPSVQPQGQPAQQTVGAPSFNAPENLEGTGANTKEDYYKNQIQRFILNNPGFAPAVDKETGGGTGTGAKIVDAIGGQKARVGLAFDSMDAQGRANVLSTMLADPNTEKALLGAMETGDLDALHMFFGSGNADPNAPADVNAEALKIVWDKMPEDQKARFIDAGKKCAWNGIKSDFFGNLPKAISLWFKMKGWDQMGEFAQDPLKFYLSVAGILGGGALLIGGLAGGSDDEKQPIVINNGNQENPYYSGTL